MSNNLVCCMPHLQMATIKKNRICFSVGGWYFLHFPKDELLSLVEYIQTFNDQHSYHNFHFSRNTLLLNKSDKKASLKKFLLHSNFLISTSLYPGFSGVLRK